MAANPRLLSITSPLGEGALIATRLSVTEQLGLPYSIDVEVLGSDAGLQASDLLTREITVTVEQRVMVRPSSATFTAWSLNSSTWVLVPRTGRSIGWSRFLASGGSA